jgi:HSP20 family molecular chaperone IbpA
MFRRADPTDWMWAHACDLIDQAERMHRQFFRLAASPRTQAIWEPPVDVFEDDREVRIVVALPGVTPERLQITHEAGELVVRAERAIAFDGSRQVVRQLEIPYGYFEARIPLPEVPLESISQELANGCLVLRLRKAR